MIKLVHPNRKRQLSNSLSVNIKMITFSTGLLLQDPKITNNLSALSAIKPYLMSRLFPASLADMWRKIIQHCRINKKIFCEPEVPNKQAGKDLE